MQARSPWARLCLALLAHALSALALFGQGGTAQLVGRVTDPSGAVIPGASVTLTNVGSGVAQTAQTGPQGYYRFPLLPPGNYEIAVQSEGFRRVAQTGIKLDVEQAATLDVELEVGQITETVQVTAAPPLLEGENATVGQVVENKSIVEMPLNGRSAWNLVQLAGATTFIKGIGDAGEIPVATVAGSRAFTQGLYIDGGSVQKSGLNRSMAELAPMVDAVEEFKVITNGYSAEFGRSAGGVFSAVTKSGTNEFHGNLFEFFRNDKMDARNFFSIDKPRLRYNQYGGTLGGPIIKDKTHFFIAYEGTRTSTGSVFVGTMPTPAMHEGDFSGIVDSQGRSLQLYDPLTTQPDPSDPTRQVRDPFANNQIPTSRFDPVAAKVATFYPGPNQAGNRAGANNFNVNVTPKRRQDHGTIKIDHQLTQKDRIFGRYIGQYNFRPQVSVFPNPDANSVGPSTRSIGNLAHTFAGGWTRTISPRVVNDLKISYLKQFRDLSHSSLGKDWPSQLGLTGVDELSFPRFRPAGYTSVGGTANVYRVQRGPTMMLSDSITYLTGRHQMKAGFEFRWNGTTDQFRVLPSGDFVHPQQGTGLQGVTASGNGYATFLTGFTANANIRDSPALTFRSQYYGFFVQDDWKITPKLTLNIGVRYDVETPRISPDNNSNGFDMQAINPVAHRPGVVTFAGVDGEPRRTYNFDKNNIAPRFGFAYRMFGGKHRAARRLRHLLRQSGRPGSGRRPARRTGLRHRAAHHQPGPKPNTVDVPRAGLSGLYASRARDAHRRVWRRQRRAVLRAQSPYALLTAIQPGHPAADQGRAPRGAVPGQPGAQAHRQQHQHQPTVARARRPARLHPVAQAFLAVHCGEPALAELRHVELQRAASAGREALRERFAVLVDLHLLTHDRQRRCHRRRRLRRHTRQRLSELLQPPA
ncbi:MAG: TonB-dependent receptor [Bryobacterales bacterium]